MHTFVDRVDRNGRDEEESAQRTRVVAVDVLGLQLFEGHAQTERSVGDLFLRDAVAARLQSTVLPQTAEEGRARVLVQRRSTCSAPQ
jgi:hypothetical protein